MEYYLTNLEIRKRLHASGFKHRVKTNKYDVIPTVANQFLCSATRGVTFNLEGRLTFTLNDKDSYKLNGYSNIICVDGNEYQLDAKEAYLLFIGILDDDMTVDEIIKHLEES